MFDVEALLQNKVKYEICETQGNIYEYMACRGADMEDFSDKYMKSDFVFYNFDTLYSPFQIREPEESLDYLLPEVGNFPGQGKYFDRAVAFWIGFIYRALYICTERKSRELCTIIPFQDMCRMYPGYHTMDEVMQVERIIENYHLD